MSDTPLHSRNDATFDVDTRSYLIVHRLRCDNKQRYHSKHLPLTYFQDPPRLLEGANRASQPRGNREIRNVERWIDEQQDMSFAVYIDYDCNSYHAGIENLFQYQPMPRMEEDLAVHVRPYFYTLKANADTATAKVESIHPSRNLKAAMEQLSKYELGHPKDWSTADNLCYPYLQLFHSKYLFGAPSISLLSDMHRFHIQALFVYVEQRMASEFTEANALFKVGMVNRAHWSKLFRPNETVIRYENGHPMAYISTSCPLTNPDVLTLQCWSWEFDGRFWKTHTIMNVHWPSLDEAIPITSLPVYPLRFDTTGLSERLRERGRVIWSCRHKRFVGYDVPARNMELQVTNLRYMIDMTTYQLMHGSEKPTTTREELPDSVVQADEPPEGSFLLLLPALVKGFGFHDKKWKILQAENIHEIVWYKDVFDHRLVLDAKDKKLIRALVTVHVTRDKVAKTDFLEGKGEGLIMLLHGGPGTGKTLTAESVAEIAERPLYRVTCGDVGTDAESVERYLKAVLDMGTRWGSVVLLDEADIFLEERSKMDLQRNALVSVFLRVLEYYSGILILTTNRIGLFDEAFKSRINLSLHYPKLNAASRERVWRNFGKSLEARNEIDKREIEEHADELAKHDLNGRQIRNVINIARDLAVYDKKALSYEFIDAALTPVIKFEHFLSEVQPVPDEERAREMAIR